MDKFKKCMAVLSIIGCFCAVAFTLTQENTVVVRDGDECIMISVLHGDEQVECDDEDWSTSQGVEVGNRLLVFFN